MMEHLIAFVCGGVFTLFGGAFLFNLLTFIESWEDFFRLIGWRRMAQRYADKRIAAALEYEKQFAPGHVPCAACNRLPELWEDYGHKWFGENFALCESCFETWLWERDLDEDAGRETVPMGAWAEAQRKVDGDTP